MEDSNKEKSEDQKGKLGPLTLNGYLALLIGLLLFGGLLFYYKLNSASVVNQPVAKSQQNSPVKTTAVSSPSGSSSPSGGSSSSVAPIDQSLQNLNSALTNVDTASNSANNVPVENTTSPY